MSQKNVEVFSRRSGRAIGFEKCVNLAQEHLKLSDEQAGLLGLYDDRTAYKRAQGG